MSLLRRAYRDPEHALNEALVPLPLRLAWLSGQSPAPCSALVPAMRAGARCDPRRDGDLLALPLRLDVREAAGPGIRADREALWRVTTTCPLPQSSIPFSVSFLRGPVLQLTDGGCLPVGQAPPRGSTGLLVAF